MWSGLFYLAPALSKWTKKFILSMHIIPRWLGSHLLPACLNASCPASAEAGAWHGAGAEALESSMPGTQRGSHVGPCFNGGPQVWTWEMFSSIEINTSSLCAPSDTPYTSDKLTRAPKEAKKRHVKFDLFFKWLRALFHFSNIGSLSEHIS